MPADVVVAGRLARDLVLVADDVPLPGHPVPVRGRRETLGGKGANQAVAPALARADHGGAARAAR